MLTFGSEMKALLTVAVLLAGIFAGTGVSAQGTNAKTLEIGVTLGQVGSFTDIARFGIGASVSFAGAYVDFLHANPRHKYFSYDVDARWDDNEAFCINAGYQIQILPWLRILPLVGYAQTNEGVTDGTSSYYSGDESGSWVHPYTVTPGSRNHYFNYGGGISIHPVKYFSVNLIATRRAIYGGIVLNLLAFAGR